MHGQLIIKLAKTHRTLSDPAPLAGALSWLWLCATLALHLNCTLALAMGVVAGALLCTWFWLRAALHLYLTSRTLGIACRASALEIDWLLVGAWCMHCDRRTPITDERAPGGKEHLGSSKRAYNKRRKFWQQKRRRLTLKITAATTQAKLRDTECLCLLLGWALSSADLAVKFKMTLAQLS